MVGRVIAHYEVIEKLGEGGMGIVYKARDKHLDRFVAIKILSPDRVVSAHRKQRFVQEAKSASALSHPNIVHIYDIGEADGIDFIAMEFVAGKALDRMIPRHGMQPAQALRYAVQIADALAGAHAAGIVHRDLKPGNVMVSDQGLVKVLDFGLAKLTDKVLGELEDATRTLKQPVTEEGTIVGTAAYMSPEQAEGKPVDARSDIFSFGSLLYEMLTGRRAFQGETQASTIAAILKEDPKPASHVVEKMPAELDRIVRRCLRKIPAQRFQHMDDLKVALEELKQESDSGVLAAPELANRTKRRPRPLWTAGAAVLLAFVAAGIWFARSRTSTQEPELTAEPLTAYPGSEDGPSFSPDGTEVTFTWCKDSEPERCNIYVKEVGVEPPFRLTDTAAMDCCPAWSPDGRYIAFVRRLPPARFSVVLIPKRGGRERVLTEFDGSGLDPFVAPNAGVGASLAWTPDSKWLAVPDAEKAGWALSLLSVHTGEKRNLTRPPATALGDGTPAFSPDGRALLFCRRAMVDTGICLLRLGEGYTPQGEPVSIRSSDLWNAGAAWLPDGREVVFSSTAGLWRMALSGSAGVRRLPFASGSVSSPAISRQQNRLAFVVWRSDMNIWRTVLGNPARKPSPTKFISSTRDDYSAAYSPDGKRIAFVSDRSGSSELWVCDSDGSNPVPLTSVRAPRVLGPRWSPDGRSIAFWLPGKGRSDIYEISSSGGADRRLETGRVGGKWPYWSRDGRFLYLSGDDNHRGIWKVLSTGGHAVQLTRGDADDVPQESPDGGFVYYQTGWPSELTVWKMPVQGGEPAKVLERVHPFGQWTVTRHGIFYVTESARQGRFDIRLYDFASAESTTVATMDRRVQAPVAVSPDGRTLLYTQADEAGSDLMLVENFR